MKQKCGIIERESYNKPKSEDAKQPPCPPERTKRILGRFHGIGANCVAALLGTVTPFCSCSSIPLFIGFTSAGLPFGVTFSFLISSPMVDLGSLVLLMSIFGWKVAVIYVILGLAVAVLGGTMIEKLHLENEVEEFIRRGKEAVQKIGLNIEVEYITDMEKIMEYGVMRMPALVVNEQIASMGKVLKAADVENLLRQYGE